MEEFKGECFFFHFPKREVAPMYVTPCNMCEFGTRIKFDQICWINETSLTPFIPWVIQSKVKLNHEFNTIYFLCILLIEELDIDNMPKIKHDSRVFYFFFNELFIYLIILYYKKEESWTMSMIQGTPCKTWF